MSGALQDSGRAKIYGQTTFGTGTVLNEFDLSDGSALLVGTVEWLTPTGRQIWHHGIAPDVTVALPTTAHVLTPDDIKSNGASAVTSADDAQLKAAVDVHLREVEQGPVRPAPERALRPGLHRPVAGRMLCAAAHRTAAGGHAFGTRRPAAPVRCPPGHRFGT